MKNFILKTVSVLFIIFNVIIIVACGDGDGESSGSSKVPAPYLTDVNGNNIHVLSIGSGTEKLSMLMVV